jgi:hypothetical protein
MRATFQTGSNTGSRVPASSGRNGQHSGGCARDSRRESNEQNDETTAAQMGMASSVLWAVGALVAFGAESTVKGETPGILDVFKPKSHV